MLPLFTQFADACTAHVFFGLPTWYSYLTCQKDAQGHLVPIITGPADVWLILAAVIDILLRLSALIAIGFVVYGGVQYTTSQGQPDATAKARNTIISALVGLAIAISAAAMVAFIAGRFN